LSYLSQFKTFLAYSSAGNFVVGLCVTLIVWHSPSKEEDHYTFRTIPREHWQIGNVHGTPKLTIKKPGPAGLSSTPLSLSQQNCIHSWFY